MRISNDKGFTLTELIFVIGILGILLGIGSMYYKGMRDRYDVEKQMKEMYVDLMSARIRAMQRNRTHFITFTATQYTVNEDTSPAPDGDGLFTAGTDSLVMQKSLMPSFPITYPAAWNNNASLLQFTNKGILDTSVTSTGTVRVTVDASGEYDCIAISEVRNALGKWDGTNGICRPK